MPLKIASWNIEWADTLLEGSHAPVKTDGDTERRDLIYGTLCEIDPDIFCMIEGPKGEERAREFGTEVLHDDWVPVLLGDGSGAGDKVYDTLGFQWIWFFVKPALKDRCRLQSPAVWQEKTTCRKWDVHLWGEPYTTTPHEHYRHPQVLVYRFDDGREMDLIGVHLKSGYMNTKFGRDADGNINRDYLDEALTNRIKLATEARDVRDYVSQRFKDCGDNPPAIIILGDCNDGEGQDYFERNYLFFSVVSNLEGNLLESEEFFYHALFDFDPGRCWSIRFDDPVTGKKAADNPLLLDHILYSQPLRTGPYPLRATTHAGLVEHAAWEKFSMGKKNPASDHRPVSITLT
jgi:hypothetical protein